MVQQPTPAVARTSRSRVQPTKPVASSAIDLDACFAALADPTRRAVIERLAAGEATMGELADPLPMSLVAVQKHVRVLEEAGMVKTHKQGRSRHVRLAATPMKEAVNWMNRYRAFWEPRLDKLAALLESHPDKE